MGPVVRVVVLGTLSNSGHAAEWEQVATEQYQYGGQLHKKRYFIDKTSVKPTGRVIQLWSLVDFSARQPFPDTGAAPYYQSIKTYSYIDCPARKEAVVRALTIEGKKGEGKVLRDHVFGDQFDQLEWSLLRLWFEPDVKKLELVCGR